MSNYLIDEVDEMKWMEHKALPFRSESLYMFLGFNNV